MWGSERLVALTKQRWRITSIKTFLQFTSLIFWFDRVSYSVWIKTFPVSRLSLTWRVSIKSWEMTSLPLGDHCLPLAALIIIFWFWSFYLQTLNYHKNHNLDVFCVFMFSLFHVRLIKVCEVGYWWRWRLFLLILIQLESYVNLNKVSKETMMKIKFYRFTGLLKKKSFYFLFLLHFSWTNICLSFLFFIHNIHLNTIESILIRLRHFLLCDWLAQNPGSTFCLCWNDTNILESEWSISVSCEGVPSKCFFMRSSQGRVCLHFLNVSCTFMTHTHIIDTLQQTL